jgi:hypothetical protein
VIAAVHLATIAAAFIPTLLVPMLVPVRVMVVFEPAALASPIARNKPAAVVIRLDPVRACIRRLRPVPDMPLVVRALGEPVTVDPHKFRARLGRYVHGARRRRGTDRDTDGNLGARW